MERQRIYGLDILRCYAVLLVLWLHATTNLLPPEISTKMMVILNFDPIGLFFVLSGYLIGMILVKKLYTNKLDLSGYFKFLQQRALRILPLYFSILLLTVFFSSILYSNFSEKDSWPYFLLMQNFRSNNLYFFEESWSLSVEVWFYIIASSLIFFFRLIAKSINGLFLAGTIIILSSIALRMYKYNAHPPKNIEGWLNDFRFIVSANLDYPVYGLIGAGLHFRYTHFWNKYKKNFMFCGIFMILLFNIFVFTLRGNFSFITTFSFCVFSNTLLSLCIVLCLPYLSSLESGKGLLHSVITYVSQRSYSLYLIHSTLIINMLFNTVLRKKLETLHLEYNTGMAVAFYISFWLIVFPIANITYNFIELPFMNYRSRLNKQNILSETT